MKRICHLTSVHKWNDVRIFEKECVSLAKAGFDVSLIAVNCKPGKFEGVNIISVNIADAGRLKRMTGIVNAVFQTAVKVNADLYHLHDPELLRIARKLKKLGKKVVYDSHEDLPRQILDKTWITPLIRKSVAGITEKYEDRVAARLDGVVAATPLIRDRFLKINRNTIDVNNYPIVEKFHAHTNWNDKKNEICYIGGIFSSRGIPELIDAVELTDARLNLAGNYSPESFRKKLMTKKGWSKVNEHGFADRKKIQDILSTSKAGVVTLHPTRAYLHSLPVKMFEYMAAGIPIIASDFPLWKDLIEKHKCGLYVDPNDSKAIAGKINYLLSHEHEAKQMGTNGRVAVEREFSWKTEANKLAEFYNYILNK